MPRHTPSNFLKKLSMMSLSSILKDHKVGIRQLVLYGFIGACCATLDFVSFSFFRHIGTPLLLSNIASVHIGIGVSFLLNAFFNFKKTDYFLRRSLTFLGVGYFGLAISSGLLYFGVSVLGYPESVIKLATIIVVAAVQFILNKKISFKEMEP